MADSFNKKEREKKKKKRKKDKEQRKEQRRQEGKSGAEFMYLDEDGNLTTTPPDPNRKSTIKAEDIEIGVPKKVDSDESKFSRKGTVKFFNTDKGYGFIIDNDTKESFFVHAANLIDSIQDNDKVVFEVGKGPKGPIALEVKLA
ncbi:MAG: cold shock domain-containing protein [Bacteroidota bacterium]